MSGFVTFPGTATDYVATPDVNLLDADTAHFQQGKGKFSGAVAGFNASTTNPASPVAGFGDNALRCVVASVVAEAWVRVQNADQFIVATNTYTHVMSVMSSVAGREARIVVNWRNAADGSVSDAVGDWIALSTTAWTDVVITGVAPANATRSQFRIEYQNPTGDIVIGDIMWVDTCCIREGTTAEFVPSLQIVGTLGETKDPTDLAVAYTAGELTIGKSWAGDGVSYERRDGTTGPIVARFDAVDVLAAVAP